MNGGLSSQRQDAQRWEAQRPGFGRWGAVAGIVLRPRRALAAVARAPVWWLTWSTLLVVWALCGGLLLSTEVGRQALVDERVRVVETFGGVITAEQYAELLARPPWWIYFTSGGRTLLAPPVTLLAAVGVWLLARREGASPSLSQAMALSVYSSVVLVIGQVVATPLHYVRESLTSPLNMAAILPLMEEGTLPARFFGTLDFFALWWVGLLALSLSVLTGRRMGRYLWPLVALYLVFAASMAGLIAIMGGN